jgi:DNA modification methylase
VSKAAAKSTKESRAAIVADRRIEYLPLEGIEGALRNPKLHALGDLGVSIGGHGLVEVPTLDERTGRLVAGHGRIEALRARKAAGEAPPGGVRVDEGGKWLVPVLRGWASATDAQAENYLVASNQLTTAGGWDTSGLTDILRDLAKNDSLEGLGFNAGELERLLTEQPSGSLADPDDVPPVPKKVWVETGMMFQLGRHRIVCGDSTNSDVAARLMESEKADVCWTDPPWNVAYGESDVPGGWSKKHAPIENDNLGDAFPGFCAAFVSVIHEFTNPGAALYMAMSAQEWPTIDGALRHEGFHWSSTLIWGKDSLVLSRKDYHTQYEPIWYGWNGDGARLHPLRDRKQSDLWNIPRPKRSDEHPTMKPVELIARALRNSSGRRSVVFEPFSGSGSTIIACEVTGRQCRAIELSPAYVQVALERWSRFTGREYEKL